MFRPLIEAMPWRQQCRHIEWYCAVWMFISHSFHTVMIKLHCASTYKDNAKLFTSSSTLHIREFRRVYWGCSTVLPLVWMVWCEERHCLKANSVIFYIFLTIVNKSHEQTKTNIAILTNTYKYCYYYVAKVWYSSSVVQKLYIKHFISHIGDCRLFWISLCSNSIGINWFCHEILLF